MVMRPPAPPDAGSSATDESTDNYDTIQWLLDNLDNH